MTTSRLTNSVSIDAIIACVPRRAWSALGEVRRNAFRKAAALALYGRTPGDTAPDIAIHAAKAIGVTARRNPLDTCELVWHDPLTTDKD